MSILTKKEVWVFGNPDLKPDALPLQLIPELKNNLPHLNFVTKDPNEEWDLPDHLVIVDTIINLDRITIFKSLDDFADSPRLTMHDFDLLTNLKWLAKLDKLPPFIIIGIPPSLQKKTALQQLSDILLSI